MLADSIAPHHSEGELIGALSDLRRSTLLVVSIAMLAAAWAWTTGSMIISGIVTSRDVPALCLIALTALVLRLRRAHFSLACWVLLLGMVGLQALLVAQYPGMVAVAFGVVGVVVANALLNAGQSALVSALLWGASVGTLWRHGDVTASQVLTTLVLYMATVAAAWLTGRSLRMSVCWALTGWQHANAALDEARERRGELYRALKALEEATYRIERMNQELILARCEAEQARAAKTRFAYTVSHELRGPLSMILGFSRLMALSPEKYGVPLPAPYYADVDAIYRNTRHLSSLLDDVLDLAQIEAERLPLIKDRVDVEKDVCRTAVDIVQPLAARKRLTLRVLSDGDLPQLMADKIRLRQVLLNLLTNAVGVTEQGGITVRLTLQDDTGGDAPRLHISVEDTGPGIDPEEMPRLFEEFHRLGRQRGEPGGSGLGLAISKQLIELQGGEIWAESRKGVGSTFRIMLPLPGTTPNGASPFPSLPAPVPGRLRAGTVRPVPRHLSPICILVQMPPRIVRLLARYLEGYRVVALPSADSVQALIQDLRPTAIITTGAYARRVTDGPSDHPLQVPVISLEIPDSVAEDGQNGVLGHLVKPISPEMLAPLMRRVERDGETTLLLVDDDPDFVRLLEGMLTALPRPYRILRAYDGLEAWALMKDERPDVVFADLVMPEMGGLELIRRMRADPRLCGVPVVIVSAHDAFDDNALLQLPLHVHSQRKLNVGQVAPALLSLLKLFNPRDAAEPTPF